MARYVMNPWNTNDKAEVLRKFQGSVYFEKTVTASSASGTHAKLVCIDKNIDAFPAITNP